MCTTPHPSITYLFDCTGSQLQHTGSLVVACGTYLEKAMALHSSTLAWKIPWTEEPGGLQSIGSLRVRHD